MKVCTKCGIEKKLEDFNKHKTGKHGHKSQCRQCCKDYRFENREHFNKKCREYYDKVKNTPEFAEKMNQGKAKKKEFNKKYKQEHKDRINDVTRVYNRNRAKNDPLFRLRRNLRTLICKVFELKGIRKNSKSSKMLGCTFDFFREHLISTAIKNYGYYNEQILYNIDHIIPFSSATTEEEAIKLTHYTNFQYLKRFDNISKSDRLDYVLPTPPVQLPLQTEQEYLDLLINP